MSSTQTTRKKVSNLIGYKFGRLEVLGYLGIGKHSKHYWLCRCICGNETKLATYRITGKNFVKSCGCYRKDKLSENRFDGLKHGMHDTKLYAIYHGMLQRCYNSNNQRYKYYGLKNITVCEDWLSNFETFSTWALSNGYKEGLSIDRINSNLGYCPDNCEWVTISENSIRMNNDRRRKI